MKRTSKSAAASRGSTAPTLIVKVEIDPLVDVVRRHVKLSPRVKRLIEDDLARLFRSPTLPQASRRRSADRTARADPVLTTQEAADLVGVSRPYIVARIEAGDIALHQQVGNQRRVLKSAVEAWHRREQTQRRRGLGKLGAEWQALAAQPLGATGRAWQLPADTLLRQPASEPVLPIAVVGAHLSGLPLNHQLTDLGATLIQAAQSAPAYRLYALPGTRSQRPGPAHGGREAQRKCYKNSSKE